MGLSQEREKQTMKGRGLPECSGGEKAKENWLQELWRSVGHFPHQKRRGPVGKSRKMPPDVFSASQKTWRRSRAEERIRNGPYGEWAADWGSRSLIGCTGYILPWRSWLYSHICLGRLVTWVWDFRQKAISKRPGNHLYSSYNNANDGDNGIFI